MLSKKETTIVIHVVAALFCTVGYLYAGAVFKIIVLPYIVWMVFKKSSVFLPALCIHLISETMSMYTIYITAGIVCIIHYKELSAYAARWLLNLLILITPVFLLLFYTLFFRNGVGFNDTIIRLDFFMPLYAFFYGILISRDFDKSVVHAIFWVMLLLLFINETGWLHARLIFFALPLWCAAVGHFFLKKKKRSSSFAVIAFVSIIVFIRYFVGIGNSTFTLLLLIFFSMLFAFFYYKFPKVFSSGSIPIVPYLLVAATMAYGIKNFDKFDFSDFDAGENISIKSSNALASRFEYKLLGDRAPFWAAGFTQIVGEANLFPPVVIDNVTGSYADDSQFEVGFGAHNLYLDIIRYYGIIPGSLTIFLFIAFMFLGAKVLTIKNIYPPFLFICTTVIAVGIVGSLTGRFPLQGPFALVSIGLSGVGYAFNVKAKGIVKKA